MQLRFGFRPVISAGERLHFEELQWMVFGRNLPQLPMPMQGLRSPSMSILAYLNGRKTPVGALTVVDTTDDALSRIIYRIPESYGSTAFYGGMMVLPEYRGLAVPVRLLFEAQRLFVNELGIRSTWLLYPEKRIHCTRLVSILKYRPMGKAAHRESSANRVLIRKEPLERQITWNALSLSNAVVSARQVAGN